LTNQDCIFCKIISGEIPAKLVAESTHAIAFNDIEPKQPVHVLIVPREHHANISELAFSNEVALVDLIQLGSKVASDLSTGSFRLQFNTGAAAGQSVFHVHGHVMSATPKA
jgi:histidine triad (HIT) family protein